MILAGGKSKPDMVALTGQNNRALVVVNGRTLLECVTDALHGAPEVGPLCVVGDMPPDTRYTVLPDGGDFVANVTAGASAYPDAPLMLVATSDLPFLTAEVVSAFVREGAAHMETTGAEILYPIVPVAECYTQYPNVKRTSLRLREGVFTGGNLMLVRPQFLITRQQWIADAYAARKSVPAIARMLGIGAILRLIVSQKAAPNLLPLAWLENRISQLLDARARALICHAPELATDLDKPADFEAIGIVPAPTR